nr:unnamed protein product [Callosobruchus analis]
MNAPPLFPHLVASLNCALAPSTINLPSVVLLCSTSCNNPTMALESDAIPITTFPRPSSSRSSEINDFDLLKELQKNIESPQKFHERAHFYTEKLEYPRRGDEPGFIFIFNQESSEHRPEKRLDQLEM